MFGCMTRLVVGTLAIGAVAYVTRDRWMARVPWLGEVVRAAAPATQRPAPDGAPAAAVRDPFVRVADSTAGAARRAAKALGVRNGPAFVAVDGEAAAALALEDLRKRLPSGMGDVAVRVEGDEVELRAVVRPEEFGGRQLLGPVYRMLPERDTVRVRGTLEGVRAGLGQFRVRGVRFRDVPLPTLAIAPLLRQVAGGRSRPAGVADDAFAVPLPATVGDVRVRDGRVTLYRATP